MQRSITYSELALLTSMFEEQCKDKGIVWTDKEIEMACFDDFCQQYIEGCDEPKVYICGMDNGQKMAS